MSEDVYVCFTDIAGSTASGKHLGNELYDSIKRSHFSILDRLAGIHGLEYEKSTGDGRLVTFSSLEKVLSFATALRFCCGSSSARSPRDVKIRISIAHGPVIKYSDGDVSGTVVNFAARLNSIDDFGDIIICADTAKNINLHYGESIANTFLINDTINLKDFPETSFFRLNPEKFSASLPKISFQNDTKTFLESLDIVFSNIEESKDLIIPNSIIWPVVPRLHVNLIHHGMIEVLTIFALLGWEIKILIADYAGTLGRSYDADQNSTNFENRLNSIFSKRNISVEILKLSQMIESGNKETCCNITKGALFDYLAPLNVSDIAKIVNKGYSCHDKLSPTKPSWSLMRPFFTLAAAINISSASPDRKKVILSGQDELPMWEKCTKQSAYENTIGTIHIPVLQNEHGNQLSLENTDLYWQSYASLQQEFATNNKMARWALKMIVATSKYPIYNDKFSICEDIFVEMDLVRNDTKTVPPEMLRALAKEVYNNHLA